MARGTLGSLRVSQGQYLWALLAGELALMAFLRRYFRAEHGG